MHHDAVLPTFRLEPRTAIAQAHPWQTSPATLASPALEVMTDLTKVKSATTSPATTLRQAEQTMIYQGVRMLFVVTDMPSIEGIITTTDLHGEKQMRMVHERNVRYDDLCVADVMIDLSMLDAIDHERMRTASVGDVVATLNRFGRNHLLVVQSANWGWPSASPRSRTASRRLNGHFSDCPMPAASRRRPPEGVRKLGAARCITVSVGAGSS